MNKFTQHINVAYPSGNKPIFEEWFAENYKGCNTDRVLMPFFPTSYFVNNGYNENEQANREAQEYVDSLDHSKKWLIICQYDNGVIVDWKGMDVLEFNMSKKIGVEMPLLCQPHPYKFDGDKKYIASFVGSRTHPIRNELENLKGIDGFYISFEPHDIERYCEIISQSVFSLCPRGYGLNSFRTSESLQYRSIPVYISDEFINPFTIPFEEIGITITDKSLDKIDEILQSVPIETIFDKQEKLPKIYQDYYTYEGAMKQIIKILEEESASKT